MFESQCIEYTEEFLMWGDLMLYYNFNVVEYFPAKQDGDAMLCKFILN